jgi:hypothetical protein
MSFSVWPGRGCESGMFGLARHEAVARAGDVEVTLSDPGRWTGEDWSKTLYAASPLVGGDEHFVRCHLGRARDLSKLLADLREAERTVARIVGGLAGAIRCADDGVLAAPMLARPDYEHVEAGALRRSPAAWGDEVVRLLERTREKSFERAAE